MGHPTAATPAFTAVGMFGTSATAEGLAAPTALAADSSGNLIVLDTGNGELDRDLYSAAAYTYDGTFLGGARSTFAGSALSTPTDLALSGSDLFVLDAGNNRVVKLDLTTGTATVPVTDLSWSGASGIAVDGSGVLFVADTQNHRVLRYAPGAAKQVIGGCHGRREGQVATRARARRKRQPLRL